MYNAAGKCMSFEPGNSKHVRSRYCIINNVLAAVYNAQFPSDAPLLAWQAVPCGSRLLFCQLFESITSACRAPVNALEDLYTASERVQRGKLAGNCRRSWQLGCRGSVSIPDHLRHTNSVTIAICKRNLVVFVCSAANH